MGNRNRARGGLFKQAVFHYLRASGLPVTRKPGYSRLSAELSEDKDTERSDLQGLDGWHLRLRDTTSRELPRTLDQARDDAKHDSKARYAVIWRRRDDVENETFIGRSYVVLDLDTFADLLADGQQPLAH